MWKLIRKLSIRGMCGSTGITIGMLMVLFLNSYHEFSKTEASINAETFFALMFAVLIYFICSAMYFALKYYKIEPKEGCDIYEILNNCWLFGFGVSLGVVSYNLWYYVTLPWDSFVPAHGFLAFLFSAAVYQLTNIVSTEAVSEQKKVS